jgi:hypothetical protein
MLPEGVRTLPEIVEYPEARDRVLHYAVLLETLLKCITDLPNIDQITLNELFRHHKKWFNHSKYRQVSDARHVRNILMHPNPRANIIDEDSFGWQVLFAEQALSVAIRKDILRRCPEPLQHEVRGDEQEEGGSTTPAAEVRSREASSPDSVRAVHNDLPDKFNHISSVPVISQNQSTPETSPTEASIPSATTSSSKVAVATDVQQSTLPPQIAPSPTFLGVPPDGFSVPTAEPTCQISESRPAPSRLQDLAVSNLDEIPECNTITAILSKDGWDQERYLDRCECRPQVLEVVLEPFESIVEAVVVGVHEDLVFLQLPGLGEAGIMPVCEFEKSGKQVTPGDRIDALLGDLSRDGYAELSLLKWKCSGPPPDPNWQRSYRTSDCGFCGFPLIKGAGFCWACHMQC